MMTETATGKVDGFPLLSANFNAEGRADLVTALPNEYLVEAFVVWQGTGGTMEAIDKITVDYAYPAVAAGDLDGDRRADLVVGFQDLDSRPSIQVFLSRSGRLMPGGFYRGGRSPRSIVIADFNQDGWKDIATANMDAVTVLINKGDGTFRDPWFFAAGTDPWSLVTGDFNRDGKLDLAAGHESGILILLGVGNGEFSRPRDIPLKERPLALAAGDFNADGVDDLAISRHQGGVRVLPGFNDGWFREVWDAGVQGVVQSLSVADLNRDGRADLIVAGNGGVSGWLSR
jgi:hypothetical protein